MDYGFDVADFVYHKRDSSMSGIVVQIDSDFDLGGVTTCLVAWGVDDLNAALTIPAKDLDIQWTKKLELASKHVA